MENRTTGVVAAIAAMLGVAAGIILAPRIGAKPSSFRCRVLFEQLGVARRRAIEELAELADDGSLGSSALLQWIEIPDAALGAYTDNDFEIDVTRAATEDGLETTDVSRIFQRHGLAA